MEEIFVWHLNHFCWFLSFFPSSNGVLELYAKIQSLRAITTKAQHPISPSKCTLLLKRSNKAIALLACTELRRRLAIVSTSPQAFLYAIAFWVGVEAKVSPHILLELTIFDLKVLREMHFIFIDNRLSNAKCILHQH